MILLTKRIAGLAVAAAAAASIVLSAAPASAHHCGNGLLTPDINCTINELFSS